ncbi:MAG: rhomboid family intramembrane serine protease [Chitinophagales bacterium]
MLTNSVFEDLKYQLRYGGIVVKLIAVNVALFLVFVVASLILEHTFLSQNLLNYVGVPADVIVLARRPWTLFSYMFSHAGLFHVIFNMIGLYWFGEIFVLYLGERRVLPLYVLGGLAGALIYLAAFNLIPAFKPQVASSVLVGASGSIFAIMFATVAINPDHKVSLLLFGEVKIVYVALGALLIGIISVLQGSNQGGVMAHLGGAIYGYAYIKALHSGTDISGPFSSSASGLKNIFKRRAKMKVTHKATTRLESKDPNQAEQEQIDKILDKISRSGYDSLTKEERDFLFEYSKK